MLCSNLLFVILFYRKDDFLIQLNTELFANSHNDVVYAYELIEYEKLLSESNALDLPLLKSIGLKVLTCN